MKTYIADNPNLKMFKISIQRYMRRATGLRYDLEQILGFQPDLDDPCINIVNENRLKYQFYKILGSISGKVSDQQRVHDYIQELRQDPERYDTDDLVYFSPYTTWKVADEHKVNPQLPVIQANNPSDESQVMKYQPFVIIYQSKEMRQCTMKYGQKIVSTDSTHSTTNYGFKIFALVSLNEFRNIRTLAVFVLQHETKQLILFALQKIIRHIQMKSQFIWSPKAIIVDKSDAEIGAASIAWPTALLWLCLVHVDRDWSRELNKRLGKKGCMVLKVYLQKMMYVRSEESMLQTQKKILRHVLVCDDAELKQYLKKEWFNCTKMWCLCYRQFYHKLINTTNASESWFQLSVSVAHVATQVKQTHTQFPEVVVKNSAKQISCDCF